MINNRKVSFGSRLGSTIVFILITSLSLNPSIIKDLEYIMALIFHYFLTLIASKKTNVNDSEVQKHNQEMMSETEMQGMVIQMEY
jgi:hypothetical protein